jgi:Mg-chelatase subunit ChlD
VTHPNQYKLFNSAGGTSPIRAIKTARRVFAQSKAKHKFLVNITDGQWGRWGEPEAEIESMKMMGVVTSIFGLDNAVSRYGLHGCQVGMDIEDPAVIVNIVRALVHRALAESRYR